jgi:RNA polymerase sigma-70 factor (ECF subfamily)
MTECNDSRVSKLVECYYEDVLRTARKFGVSANDVEDVAQKVFILASRKLNQIELGSERSFLYGTTIRVAGDLVRSAVVRREIAQDDIDPIQTGHNLDSIVDQFHARAALDHLLSTMPDELRSVFVLYEVEELTMAQISELLRLPTGTVASRLRRSREWFAEAAQDVKATPARHLHQR